MPFAKYTTIECSSANELWDRLSPEKTSNAASSAFIYRGQADATWGLVPSVLRKQSAVKGFMPELILHTEIEILAEMELLRQFVNSCDALGLAIPNDTSRLRSKLETGSRGGRFIEHPDEWPSVDLVGLLALAQHHKVPTRLLDWTRRSHVAAYFAATDALRSEKEWESDSAIAVWALDARGLLHIDTLEEKLPGKGLYPYVRLVTAPGAVTPNLAAQVGLFTLLIERGKAHENLHTRALEDEFATLADTPLTKFILPVKCCDDLMNLCRIHYITAATMFPGYDGAGAATLELARAWRKLKMAIGTAQKKAGA